MSWPKVAQEVDSHFLVLIHLLAEEYLDQAIVFRTRCTGLTDELQRGSVVVEFEMHYVADLSANLIVDVKAEEERWSACWGLGVHEDDAEDLKNISEVRRVSEGKVFQGNVGLGIKRLTRTPVSWISWCLKSMKRAESSGASKHLSWPSIGLPAWICSRVSLELGVCGIEAAMAARRRTRRERTVDIEAILAMKCTDCEIGL